AVRIEVVAERCAIRDRNARACQIDGGVERIATVSEPVTPVGAVRQFDHDFADTDDAAGFLRPRFIQVVSAATILFGPQDCHACPPDAWPTAPSRHNSRPMRSALPINAAA